MTTNPKPTMDTDTKIRRFGTPLESPSEFLEERMGSTLVDMVIDEDGNPCADQLVFDHNEHGEWMTRLNKMVK